MTMPANGAAAQYNSRTIWFHWLTALLVAGQWIGAKTIDMWPKGALQVDAISLHITFGILLGGLVAIRIWWRTTSGRRLPEVGDGIVPLLAKTMHWGLYLLLLTVVALGLTMLSVRPLSYFNYFMLPALTNNRVLFRSVHSLHDLLATTILVAAGLHALMALVHQYVWRNGVLARMIPRLG